MTEEQFGPERDENGEPPIDRGQSLVAHQSRFATVAKLGFLLLGFGFMLYLALSSADSDKATGKPETKQPYRVAGKEGEPFIAPPKRVESKDFTVPPPPAAPPLPDNTLLQQEAIRIVREQQKQIEERLKSDQIIMHKPAEPGGVSGTPGSGSLTGVDDENAAFAERYGKQGYQTMKAEQLVKLYAIVPQGTQIAGILETAISSNLPGRTRAIVAEDVYSFDGTSLLIPTGTQLIGRYRSSTAQGQSRVFVIWQRLLRPDGVSLVLDSYGMDALGRSGLEGELDTHFMERFGSAIMLSLLDGVIQIGVNAANDADGQTLAVNSGRDVSRTAEIALENSINIRPTILVNQGERINIFVEHDLDFSSVMKGSAIVR